MAKQATYLVRMTKEQMELLHAGLETIDAYIPHEVNDPALFQELIHLTDTGYGLSVAPIVNDWSNHTR